MWRGRDKTQERREQGKESGEVRKAKERREEKGTGEKSVCLAVQYFTKEFYMQPNRCQPKALFNTTLSQAAEPHRAGVEDTLSPLGLTHCCCLSIH